MPVCLSGSFLVNLFFPGLVLATVFSGLQNFFSSVPLSAKDNFSFRRIFGSESMGMAFVKFSHIRAAVGKRVLSFTFGVALFAVNMLVDTSGGSTYTFDEIAGGRSSAGFSSIRQLQSKEMFSLVEGFREK